MLKPIEPSNGSIHRAVRNRRVGGELTNDRKFMAAFESDEFGLVDAGGGNGIEELPVSASTGQLHWSQTKAAAKF